MTSKQPRYAFGVGSDQIATRNYFRPLFEQDIPTLSKMDLMVPYFAVDLTWIKPPYEDSVIWDVADPELENRHSGHHQGKEVGNEGSFLEATTSPAKKVLLGLKTGGWDVGQALPDGTPSYEDAPCPKYVHEFGELLDIKQWRRDWPDENKKETAFECYIYAEATIVSGVYEAKGCDMTASVENADDKYATYVIERNNDAIMPDYLSSATVDFVSEIVKYARLQDYVEPKVL
ncbi:unnamed protein product [Clonostachys chloroleuca]|uniref:Uncharacterized protein n=1 Tax=Clonostachys chloroleuca TaxID=1926264 RepID=A0AA35PVV0_9HYPO|nr:unnamed protein product [Clonostachys chloroleuca]